MADDFLTIQREYDTYAKASTDSIEKLFENNSNESNIKKIIEEYYGNRTDYALKRIRKYKFFEQFEEFNNNLKLIFQRDNNNWKKSNKFGYIGYTNGHFLDYFLFTTPKSKKILFDNFMSKFKFIMAYVTKAGSGCTEHMFIANYSTHPCCLNKNDQNTSKETDGYVYLLIYEADACQCLPGSACDDSCECSQCTELCKCAEGKCPSYYKFTQQSHDHTCKRNCKCKQCDCVKKNTRCNDSCSCSNRKPNCSKLPKS